MSAPTCPAGAGALAGLRVVDFGQWLAGPLLAAWLADAEAEVIRIDPPGGPRWQHPANAVLQRGKRSIVLDLGDAGDLDVARRLVDRADVVVENFRPGVMARLGLDPDRALESNPRLLWCSLPGFSADDPRAGVPGWEGVVWAAAGLYLRPGCTPMNYVGDRGADPIYSAVPAASSYAAFVAAHSVLAALIAREHSGLGQRIEVPLFDACFELIGASVMKSDPPAPAPEGPRITNAVPQLGHYRCADGRWLELCLFQDKHLQWFAETFLPPEWIEDGMADPVRMLTDAELQERARARYAQLLATRPAREWEIAINEQSGASAALCQTSGEWLILDQHARDSGAVIEVNDHEYGLTPTAGHPIRMSATPPAVQFPRRPLDADRAAILAELENLPAPAQAPHRTLPESLARRSRDPGHRRVPGAGRPDGQPGAGRVRRGGRQDPQLHRPAARHAPVHQQRQVLNHARSQDRRGHGRLRAAGRRRRRRRAELHPRRRRSPRRRRGLRPPAHPDVVYVSISAFGHEGYRGGWRGREQLGQGPTGMQTRLGGDGEPLMAPFPYNDYGSGNLAAYAALLALFARMRGGAGQHVQSSLAHAGTFLQVPFMVASPGRAWDEPRGQQAKGWNACDRLYRAADRWFYLAAPQGLGALPDLAGLDGRKLEETFRTERAAAWVGRLQAAGIGAHVLTELTDMMDDDVARARGLFLEREHRGVGRVRMAGPSARLSRTPPRPTRPRPARVGHSVRARRSRIRRRGSHRAGHRP